MRWRGVVLAVLLLAPMAACGDDDDPSVAVDDGTTTSTAEGSEESATTTPGESSTEQPAPADSNGAPVTTVVVPDDDLAGPPGSGASWWLTPGGTPAIVLDVLVEAGAEPADDTITHVQNVLIGASEKGASAERGTAAGGREAWTADDIRNAAGPPDGAMKLLFVHGQLAESDTVLGIAVRADVAAIFVDRVRDAASPLVGPGAIEAAVTTHEVGHLLGLVDLHLQTGREDPEHPGHSSNRGSVMYWAVESSLVLDLLTGGPPRTFDDADTADLAAIRSGQ